MFYWSIKIISKGEVGEEMGKVINRLIKLQTKGEMSEKRGKVINRLLEFSSKLKTLK